MSATASGSFFIPQETVTNLSGPTMISVDPASGPLVVTIPPASLVGIDPVSNTVQLDPATIAALIADNPAPQQVIKDVKANLPFGMSVSAPGGTITVPAKTISSTWFNTSPLWVTVKMTDGGEFYVPPNGTYNLENLGAQKAGEDFNFAYIAAGAAMVSSLGNSGPNFNGLSPRLLVNFRTVV